MTTDRLLNNNCCKFFEGMLKATLNNCPVHFQFWVKGNHDDIGYNKHTFLLRIKTVIRWSSRFKIYVSYRRKITLVL